MLSLHPILFLYAVSLPRKLRCNRRLLASVWWTSISNFILRSASSTQLTAVTEIGFFQRSSPLMEHLLSSKSYLRMSLTHGRALASFSLLPWSPSSPSQGELKSSFKWRWSVLALMAVCLLSLDRNIRWDTS